MSGAKFAPQTTKEDNLMYHIIEFNVTLSADLEVSPSQRLERLRVQKGTRAYVGLRPYVVQTPGGPTEVADLYFKDGTVARQVRFEHFRFVE
jgi:hypothetical protein